jgi:MFS family permease
LKEISPEKHDPYAALRFREFRWYILGRLCITTAVNFQAVCVGWQVYEITKDAFSLGLIGLAEAVPYILIALVAGYVVDHYKRKNILLSAVFLLLLASAFLLFLSLNATSNRLLWVYVLIFFTGLARGFVSPSMFAIMSSLVPKNLYGNSSTWNSTVWQIGAVTGPALGGFVYGFYGSSNAYLLNTCLFLLAFLAFAMVRVVPHAKVLFKEGIRKSIAAGLQFVFKNQLLLSALSLDLFAVFFGGAVALLPIFADQILEVGPRGLGILRASPALGAFVMALLIAYFPLQRNAGKKLLYAVGMFGVCTIAFAISRNFYLSAFLLALCGAFDNVSVVLRSTIVQSETPDNMRGRVSSVNSIFIGSSNEIGAFESGFAARLMGLVPSVIFGGGMTLIVTAITAKVAPKLRRLNL